MLIEGIMQQIKKKKSNPTSHFMSSSTNDRERERERHHPRILALTNSLNSSLYLECFKFWRVKAEQNLPSSLILPLLQCHVSLPCEYKPTVSREREKERELKKIEWEKEKGNEWVNERKQKRRVCFFYSQVLSSRFCHIFLLAGSNFSFLFSFLSFSCVSFPTLFISREIIFKDENYSCHGINSCEFLGTTEMDDWIQDQKGWDEMFLTKKWKKMKHSTCCDDR